LQPEGEDAVDGGFVLFPTREQSEHKSADAPWEGTALTLQRASAEALLACETET